MGIDIEPERFYSILDNCEEDGFTIVKCVANSDNYLEGFSSSKINESNDTIIFRTSLETFEFLSEYIVSKLISVTEISLNSFCVDKKEIEEILFNVNTRV